MCGPTHGLHFPQINHDQVGPCVHYCLFHLIDLRWLPDLPAGFMPITCLQLVCTTHPVTSIVPTPFEVCVLALLYHQVCEFASNLSHAL